LEIIDGFGGRQTLTETAMRQCTTTTSKTNKQTNNNKQKDRPSICGDRVKKIEDKKLIEN